MEWTSPLAGSSWKRLLRATGSRAHSQPRMPTGAGELRIRTLGAAFCRPCTRSTPWLCSEPAAIAIRVELFAFLSSLAHTDEGIFSIDGKRDGVLSCYVGTAAATYLLCGETSAAQPQIGWILRYQDVSRRGEALRVDLAEHWGPYLRTRYGGCMADTTCLVGLAKVGRALQLHAADPSGDVEPLRIAIREAFLERQLMFDRDEHVVPLGVVASKATDWLLPTFPLDWRTDLIEVLDIVGKSGPFDPRMQPAIDSLMSWRLPDGSWPLRRSFWPNDVTIRERRSTQTGHPIVTLRALSALRTCHDAE